MSEDERDPFEELADDPEAAEDPFDELAGGAEDPNEEPFDELVGGGEDSVGNPFEDLAAGVDESGDDPFAELAADLEATDASVEVEEAPEDVDASFAEGDFEDLWTRLEGEEDASAGEDTEVAGRTEVVPKRDFCERCQYFSEPPDVHCTHEGTRIVEYVDNDHVRVKNCPIVAERRGTGEVE